MKPWKLSDLKKLKTGNGHAKVIAVAKPPSEPCWNKTEAAWAQQLDLAKKAGLLQLWRFEAINLRLADRTFYKPDFLVINQAGQIEFHEVKGFWRDDARVKIKVAANQFPFFTFTAVQWNRKARQWQFEIIQPHGG